jgi:hypothetical protein
MAQGPADRTKFEQPHAPTINLRSPREASKVFGFDRAIFGTATGSDFGAAPRPKSLFYVRFVLSQDAATILASLDGQIKEFNRSLGFVVKTVDRPNVEIETQELIQYNKKRQIHTLFKYHPVTITFHDTVDAKLMRMVEAYYQWFGGDFAQASARPWGYDITAPEFLSSNVKGFGFSPPLVDSTVGMNVGYFIHAIEVFQVFGRSYTVYTHVNPKITSVAPDELDYEQGTGGTVRLTFAYEALITDSQPKPIGSSPLLIEVFGLGGGFDGQIFDPEGTVQNVPADTKTTGGGSSINPTRLQTSNEAQLGFLTAFDSELAQQQSQANFRETTQLLSRAGVQQQRQIAAFNAAAQTTLVNQPSLSSFGQFDFGRQQAIQNLIISDISTGNFSNFGGALLGAAGQPVLSQAVSGQHFTRDLISGTLSSLPGPNIAGISGQAFDRASGAVGIGTSTTSGIRSPSITAAAGEGIAGALLAGAVAGQPIAQARTSAGLQVSSQTLGAINANRPPQSLFGFRTP